ncbi:hypothetical protein [uncultured Roseobacter sp.]|uniref:hypothetical protein n=1 Tax=uncultured Roseobacter sp. TaxID=114847 RepID=UPI002635379B|nr:hypothetical protein [uncultured Roseobacter sp.]
MDRSGITRKERAETGESSPIRARIPVKIINEALFVRIMLLKKSSQFVFLRIQFMREVLVTI